jgi:H+/gluconate symporter-like permease
MRAVLAILGAIAGAVVGYIAAFVVVYPILVAIEGRDMNGGIAMGVAVTVGPLMAIITAIASLFLVLRLMPPKTRPEAVAAPDPDEDPDEAYFRPPPGKSSGPDTQTLIAIGVVVVLIIAGVIWWNG